MDRSPVVTILAGRTRRLWQPLLQQLRIAHELGQRCVLIVPEHYTLQAERALISGLGTQGLLLAEVLSPSRLIQRVRDRAGTGGGAHARVSARRRDQRSASSTDAAHRSSAASSTSTGRTAIAPSTAMSESVTRSSVSSARVFRPQA